MIEGCFGSISVGTDEPDTARAAAGAAAQQEHLHSHSVPHADKGSGSQISRHFGAISRHP
jgi:hypothetical protein